MIICPKGILLNKKDSAELVRAPDAAIEERMAMMDSNLPPAGCEYSREDKVNARNWDRDITHWRKLRGLLIGGTR